MDEFICVPIGDSVVIQLDKRVYRSSTTLLRSVKFVVKFSTLLETVSISRFIATTGLEFSLQPVFSMGAVVVGFFDVVVVVVGFAVVVVVGFAAVVDGCVANRPFIKSANC